MSLEIEKKLFSQGYKCLVGVDEAGRGAWAGPIVAGAVALRYDQIVPEWVNQAKDSKIMTKNKRRELFDYIKKDFIWSVGLVDSQTIDKFGVGQANRAVVIKALDNLSITPDYVMTDFVAKIGNKYKQAQLESIIDGDAKVLLISLASIVAKVYRDELMVQYGKDYPSYGFAEHKGYGTKQHQAALTKYGLLPIHRLSYRPVGAHLL